MVANLPVLRDARVVFAKLVETGYEFHCVTSLSLDENTKILRQQNLDNVFDGILQLVCLDMEQTKMKVLNLTRFWSLDEDKTVNMVRFKIWMKPILISHNHNIDCDNPAITKCDWDRRS